MRGFIPPQNQDETVFAKRAGELCAKADRLGIKLFSNFLDLRQKELFAAQCNKYNGLSVKFYAGFEGDFERTIACVCPINCEVFDYECPITVLFSKIKGESQLNHRDFLGAIMSLMLKREYFGDILVLEDSVYIICHNTMASVIIQELKSVKRSFVDFEYFNQPLTYKRQPQLSKSVTVASLRLDAVIAAVMSISRNDSSEMIKQSMISVNHLLAKRSDFEIMDNDVLSIRSKGKYSLKIDGAKSRKDRFFITYYKY